MTRRATAQRPRRTRIGFHVSIADGLPKAVDRALERGCTAFQIFCASPRAWAWSERSADEIEEFKRARKDAGLDPLVVHACYLINPCSADRTVRRRSVPRLRQELRLAARLGADFYVLHPGSAKGQPVERLVERAAESIRRAVEGLSAPPALLLEGTATPHGPGGDLTHLGELVARLHDSVPEARAGIALDSCHAFAAGWDLTRAEQVDRLARDVRQAVGKAGLQLLHVNDARDPAGSFRDRHEHIGKGLIGRRGLGNLLAHSAFADLPLILETPWETIEQDRRNLRAVLDILGEP